MSIPFNPSRCPHCKRKMDTGQRIHPACIDDYAQAQSEKSARASTKRALMAAKVDKALTRQKRESLKSMGQLTAEAQTAFNQYIRARDYGKPCISSGAQMAWHGQGVDAGHYRSRGSAPHLRFDERNVHAQSKHDNRYLSGNVTGYRIGLIARIGLEAVEALECDQTPRKYSRDDLKAIKATYTAKTKALKETT
jgi:hypothetical protein